MNIKTPLALSLISMVFAATTPALASFDTMLYGYLGRGKVDDRTQALVQTNLNNRQAQLEQQIASGVQSGQLTAPEQADLQASLNQVANLQGQYLSSSGGKLNNIQIQNLLNQLTSVTNKLNAYLTNSATLPGGMVNHNAWMQQFGHRDGWGNERMAEGHIDSYQTELDSSIQQALLSGKISLQAANDLHAQLNATEQEQARMTANGHFAPQDRQALITQLNSLKTRLNQDIALGRHRGRNYLVNRRETMLHQRIIDGMNTGRLSSSEGHILLERERRIQDMQAEMNAAGPSLSWSQQRELLNKMNKLNTDINNELTTHNV